MESATPQKSKLFVRAGTALCIAATLLQFLGWMPTEILALLVVLFGVLIAYRKALQQSRKLAPLLWFLLLFIGLAIGLYRPEGFHYPMVLQSDALHPQGHPFALYWNTGKTLAGYLILIGLLPLAFKSPQFISAPAMSFLLVVLMAACIIGLAKCLLGLEFYLKNVSAIMAFAVVNLFSTCVAEEAFMRLVLQNEIQRALSRYTHNLILREYGPLVITTTIFLLTHSTASAEISMLYAIAGFLYGLIYTLTKNLFFSIGLHFLVNILHFSFLTYPISA